MAGAFDPREVRTIPLERLLSHTNRWWLGWLTVVGLVLAVVSILEVHRQATAELDRAARLLVEELERDLHQRAHGLQALVHAVVQAHPQASAREWMEHAVGYGQAYGMTVALIDAERRMIMNTQSPAGSKLPEPPNPPARRVLSEALAAGAPRIGDLVFGPVRREVVVPIVVPVSMPDGLKADARLPSALVGAVPVSLYQALLNHRMLPDHLQIAVSDGSGALVASRGVDAATADGRAVPMDRIAVLRLASAPWSVTVQAPASAFYRPHAQIAAVLVMGLTLVFVGAWIGSRRASQSLAGAMQRLTPHAPAQVPPHASGAGSVKLRIAEIEAARRELLRLGRAQHQAQERERRRIARELHDGVQQEAAMAVNHLHLALARMRADPEAAALLDHARAGITRLIREVEQVVHDLRPRALETQGLSAALGELVEGMHTVGIARAELQWLDAPDRITNVPTHVADCIYRLVQESLNNVRKHARAQAVQVTVDLREPSRVFLTVHDDGVGMDLDTGPSGTGFGLLGMSQRAAELGGTFNVSSCQRDARSRGTTVSVTLPLQD